MQQPRIQPLLFAKEKFPLLNANVEKTGPFDAEKIYMADELEPYGILSYRFMRTFEVAIKFFRSYKYS